MRPQDPTAGLLKVTLLTGTFGRHPSFCISSHRLFTSSVISKTETTQPLNPSQKSRLIPRRRGFGGRLMASSCMLVGGCRVRFLKRAPCCTVDRRRCALRMIGMLHALAACCVFPLRLHASLPPTYVPFLTDERQLSRSEASCCCD